MLYMINNGIVNLVFLLVSTTAFSILFGIGGAFNQVIKQIKRKGGNDETS